MTVSRSIDLSGSPVPKLIEEIDFEVILATVIADYKSRYPQFTAKLESEPVMKLAEAFAFREMLLRIRINDVARSILAPFATGSDLDAVVASQGIVRRVLVPATDTAPAVMESDASLLRQYLLSFSTAAAGAADAYEFLVREAWPGVHDVAVNGHAIHGRKGDVEIIITGPGGAIPSAEQMAAVRAKMEEPTRKVEAVDALVQAATRAEYHPVFTIFIPSGPDSEIVRDEAKKRVRAACDARTFIGAEIPAGYCIGAVYGRNVIRVRDDNPILIPPDPYVVPVATDITINVEVMQ